MFLPFRNFKLHPDFTEEEIRHWLTPRENVVHVYVRQHKGKSWYSSTFMGISGGSGEATAQRSWQKDAHMMQMPAHFSFGFGANLLGTAILFDRQHE